MQRFFLMNGFMYALIVLALVLPGSASADTLEQIRREGLRSITAGHYPEAARIFREGLDQARACGDRVYTSKFLNNLALVEGQLGASPQTCLERYEQALAIAESIDNATLTGKYAFNLGNALLNLDRMSDAVPFFRTALKHARAAEDFALAREAALQLVQLHLVLGNAAAVSEYTETALSLCRDDRIAKATAHAALAFAHYVARLPRVALEHAEAGLQALTDVPASDQVCGNARLSLLWTSGTAHLALGNNSASFDFLTRAAALARQEAYRQVEPDMLADLIQSAGALGTLDDAIVQRALEITSGPGQADQRHAICMRIARAHIDSGTKDRAPGFFQMALGAAQETGRTDQQIAALKELGKAYCILLDNCTRGMPCYRQALEIARADAGTPAALEIEILNDMGVGQCVYLHRCDEALPYYDQALKRAAADPGAPTCESLYNLGVAHKLLENHGESLHWHARAIDRCAEENEYLLQCFSASDMGDSCRDRGDRQKALQWYGRTVRLADTYGYPEERAEALVDMGSIHADTGNRTRARDLYEEARQLYAETNNKKEQASVLLKIATLFSDHYDYDNATARIQAALSLYTDIRDLDGQARALTRLGNVETLAGMDRSAVPHYTRALEAARAAENRRAEIHALSNLGAARARLADYAAARAHLDAALTRARESGDNATTRMVLVNMALLHLYTADYTSAIECCERGRALSVADPDHETEALLLTNLGYAYCHLSMFEKQLPCSREALQIARRHGLKRIEAENLVNIGLHEDHCGRTPQALRSFEAARDMFRDIGDRNGRCRSLVNIGYIRLKQLDMRGAGQYFEEALSLTRQTGNRYIEAYVRTNMAALAYSQGDFTAFRQRIDQAMQISRDIHATDAEALQLRLLGLFHGYLGNSAEGIACTRRAAAIYDRIGNRRQQAICLYCCGWLHLQAGRIDDAVALLDRACDTLRGIDDGETASVESAIANAWLQSGEVEKARAIFRKNESRAGIGYCCLKQHDFAGAKTELEASLQTLGDTGSQFFLLPHHIGLGRACEGLGEYAAAREHFQTAVDIIEHQRAALTRSEKENFLTGRIGFGQSRTEPYEGLVRVLLKEQGQDHARRALQCVERLRAGTLWELLSCRDAIGKNARDRAIMARDREFQRDILQLQDRLKTLTGSAAGSGRGSAEMETTGQELQNLIARYEEFIKNAKLSSPEFTGMIAAQPPPVERIQALLPPDVTVLTWFLATDRACAWLVTRDRVRVYPLGDGSADTARAALRGRVNRWLRIHAAGTWRMAAPAILQPVGPKPETVLPEPSTGERREQFLATAQDLYRLLVEPVAQDIATEKLVIVPHDILHKVPFACLHTGTEYLIDRFSISVVPSLSAIAPVLSKRNPDNGHLLAFANPEAGPVSLPYAEQEVAGIAGMFSHRSVYIRGEATESQFKKSSALPDVIHVACHGEFNDAQPLQSGILMARDRDNDGILQTHELFSLDLENANLVTISACETALCKLQDGQDWIGLTRGFLYAGTPSILATLWKVDDVATERLMRTCYRFWIEEGMDKPAALRRAQLQLKADPRYSDPVYWAPFVMVGDWE